MKYRYVGPEPRSLPTLNLLAQPGDVIEAGGLTDPDFVPVAEEAAEPASAQPAASRKKGVDA